MADAGNNRIQKWAAGATTGTTVAGIGSSGSGATQLNYPNGVYVDGSSNIYVADQTNNRIQKWVPGASAGSTVAGSAAGAPGSSANLLSSPGSVFVDASGNIYVADRGNNRIQEWAPGATSGTTIAGTGVAGSSANQLSGPIGVYVDLSGNIFVADQSNNRIQEFAASITNTLTAITAGNYTARVTTAAGNATTNAVTINGAPAVSAVSPQAGHRQLRLLAAISIAPPQMILFGLALLRLR